MDADLRAELHRIELRQRSALGFVNGLVIGAALLLGALQWYAIKELARIDKLQHRVEQLEQRVTEIEWSRKSVWERRQ
ncbi:hypothetical protein IB275_30550 [Pseudomonas sp. PDM21]|uniref:hypothetical protein n=1 Tax=Pseudomonas sp. PDM21 TaxID=2769257 RepID=UPI0017856040|nr:hypothetical protein [Pseudomonas sp. PDM21]MBD9674957.1 hypothetical protein [Pseudomonas sp. PDM21]